MGMGVNCRGQIRASAQKQVLSILAEMFAE